MDRFFYVFQVERHPISVALCSEDIVNTYVFVRVDFFKESLFFFDLGWLWGVIFGGFGDLWDHFCDFLEVRKTIEILRWILEAKVYLEKKNQKFLHFIYVFFLF